MKDSGATLWRKLRASCLCAALCGLGGAVVGFCAGIPFAAGVTGDEFVRGFASIVPPAGAALLGLAGLIFGATLPFWVRRSNRQDGDPHSDAPPG